MAKALAMGSQGFCGAGGGKIRSRRERKHQLKSTKWTKEEKEWSKKRTLAPEFERTMIQTSRTVGNKIELEKSCCRRKIRGVECKSGKKMQKKPFAKRLLSLKRKGRERKKRERETHRHTHTDTQREREIDR
jgi:hypothetical protein